MIISGHSDHQFDDLRSEFERAVTSGDELGAAIAIDIDGETVVDLWGGYSDTTRDNLWQRDTIVNVWSTSKMVTALAALICVDRGLLDVYEPVATYWPEFGTNGKESIAVRQILSHTSGVSGWEPPFTTEDMFDLEASTARLATQAPWWKPGTASGYHAHNYGHLVGELVRRVSGKTLTQFVSEEIAAPLDVDLQIGVRPADCHRVAEIVPPPPLPIDLAAFDAKTPMVKTFLGPPPNAAAANTTAWQRAEIGGLNGHTNARALARTFSVISRGGRAADARLLSPETIDLIFQEQVRGTDLVLGMPMRFGIGFALPEPQSLPYIPDERICFWGGWGGSMTVMFPNYKATVSYVMNRMGPGVLGSDRSAAYFDAIVRALG